MHALIGFKSKCFIWAWNKDNHVSLSTLYFSQSREASKLAKYSELYCHWKHRLFKNTCEKFSDQGFHIAISPYDSKKHGFDFYTGQLILESSAIIFPNSWLLQMIKLKLNVTDIDFLS